MTDRAYSEWEDHSLIRGSLLDQGTKVSDTKVSVEITKVTPGIGITQRVGIPNGVYTKASHSVVFGRTDRRQIISLWLV